MAGLRRTGMDQTQLQRRVRVTHPMPVLLSVPLSLPVAPLLQLLLPLLVLLHPSVPGPVPDLTQQEGRQGGPHQAQQGGQHRAEVALVPLEGGPQQRDGP